MFTIKLTAANAGVNVKKERLEMSNRKKFMKALSAVTALTIVTGTGSLVGAALTGDANGDGLVGIQDIKALGSFIVGSSDSVSADSDMNGDGIINVFDMVALRRVVLQNPYSDTNYIHLNGASITTEGQNMELNAEGNIVTITASGTYYVDGTMTDGQIIVNVPDETVDAETVKIFLNGVDMTGSAASPIFVENAENTSINLVEGTVNTLSDGTAAYEGDYLECGVLHSKDDMTIKGTGTLNITANTQYAVQCNNDLKLNGGTLNITTELSDAVRGKKSVTVKDGIINIDSSGDGIKSTKGSVTISGGTIISAAENDAVQAETTLTVSGGEVYAYGERSFTAGTDYTVDITGGTVVGTSKEEFTNTAGITVNSMLLNYTEKISKQKISIVKNGTEVYSVTPEKKYMYALICNSALENGTYNVYTGDAQMTHDAAETEGEFVTNGTLSTFNTVTAMNGSIVTTSNTITLSSSGITFLGSGAAVSDDKNTVTITEPGTYTVKGEMEGGQIVVDVDKTTYVDATVELSLEGMSLTNTSTSPIYIASVDDKCSISAKNGTVNTISDGSEAYTNADDDSGAIYSKDDLTFKGKGTLIVNGNYADAIVSKNDIHLNNGTIQVNAADDGIRGKDSVRIGDPLDTDFSTLNVTINAKGGDGIKSTETDTTSGKGFITANGGTVNITAYSDGMHASQAITINGGDFTIKTTAEQSESGSTQQPGGPGSWGGSGSTTTSDDTSAKGIKAGCTDDTTGTEITGTITINGGSFDIDSTDDCIHANGNISLFGGVMELNSGDDAVHSDADLTIGQGDNTFDDLTVIVEACYEGMEGINVTQNSGTVIINSEDDGYNAAGGADGSGTTSPGGWGGNMGGPSSGGNYAITINGGFALVNASDGDHDGFDSNGSLSINGGYAISNGTDTFDCDGTLSYTGGVYVEEKGSGGGMGGMGGSGSMTQSVSASVSASAGTRITICDGSGNVIVSFIADKNATTITAGCTAYSGATVYTGGELSGSTYFQTVDQTQLAAYGGTLIGGTAAGGGTNPWG